MSEQNNNCDAKLNNIKNEFVRYKKILAIMTDIHSCSVKTIVENGFYHDAKNKIELFTTYDDNYIIQNAEKIEAGIDVLYYICIFYFINLAGDYPDVFITNWCEELKKFHSQNENMILKITKDAKILEFRMSKENLSKINNCTFVITTVPIFNAILIISNKLQLATLLDKTDINFSINISL